MYDMKFIAIIGHWLWNIAFHIVTAYITVHIMKFGTYVQIRVTSNKFFIVWLTVTYFRAVTANLHYSHKLFIILYKTELFMSFSMLRLQYKLHWKLSNLTPL